MRRRLLVLLPALMAASPLALGQGRTDRYRLGGQDHDVPLRYEFSRTAGLPREADGSLWLILPGAEVAEGVPGYSRVFRGYAGPVAADLIVHVFDDPEAREFNLLRSRAWSNLDARLAEGATREPEPTGGVRVVHSVSPPELQGGRARSFYLLPPVGSERPPDLAPASCLASPDDQGRERFHCSYVMHADGLTFDFGLEQDNIGTAPRMPGYIRTRLAAWRP